MHPGGSPLGQGPVNTVGAAVRTGRLSTGSADVEGHFAEHRTVLGSPHLCLSAAAESSFSRFGLVYMRASCFLDLGESRPAGPTLWLVPLSSL
jgi:hypothetical protein